MNLRNTALSAGSQTQKSTYEAPEHAGPKGDDRNETQLLGQRQGMGTAGGYEELGGGRKRSASCFGWWLHKCQIHTSEHLICVLVRACTCCLSKTQAQSPETTPKGFHNVHYSLITVSGTLGDACAELGTDVDIRC